MIRAVLDANVVVSGLIHPAGPPGRILSRCLRDAAFEIILSRPLIAELERVLFHPKVRRLLSGTDAEIRAWIASFAVMADVVESRRRLDAIPADPADAMYLEAALEGRASVVVSGDRHLLDLDEFEGIRIVTPSRFLELLA